MARLPWFPFYPLDFIGDRKVASMSMAARGAYITLLCYAWQETPKGTLPKEAIEEVSVGLTEGEQRALWSCFSENDGRFMQKRMCAESDRISEISQVKRAAAKVRWDARAMHMQSTRNAQAMQNDAITTQSHHNHITEEDRTSITIDASPNGSAPQELVLSGDVAKSKAKMERQPENEQAFRDYCAKKGIVEEDTKYLYCTWQANGWTIKGKPIKSWRHAVQSWQAAGYLPSQKTKEYKR